MSEVKICTYECPNCSAPVSITDKICNHCFSHIYIQKVKDIDKLSNSDLSKHISIYKKNLNQSFDVNTLQSLGICHYKNKMYNLALESFEKIITIEPENINAYYYSALSLLNGKRPYMQTFNCIKKVVLLLEAAISIKPEGRLYYFLYMIQVDFFDKKHLHTRYKMNDLKNMAIANAITNDEIEELEQNLLIK